VRSDCRLCAKLGVATGGQSFIFVHEFRSSMLLVGDHQYYPGYCLLVAKRHEREIHDLPPELRTALFEELMMAGEAIASAFQPWKLNYASFGNVDEHIHWHIMPRYESDPDHTEQPFKNAGFFAQKPTTETNAREVASKLRSALDRLQRNRLQ